MPELPEVETMRRGLLETVGRRIAQATLPDCSCRPIRTDPDIATICERLSGSRIKGIDRLGKRVIVRLDVGNFVFQPKMTGLVNLGPPPDPGHVRMLWRLQGRPVTEVYFWDRRGLGTIALWDDQQLEANLGEEKLGPDAIAISLEDFQQRFCKTPRAIKVALLDQKLVAGVGNLYASELLHQAGVDPHQSCRTLNAQQWEKIYLAMREILLVAIEHEGSTLGDGTYRTKLNEPGQYQNQHRVYDCAGKICSTCGRGNIERVVQSQRATFYCPICQTLPRSKKK